MPSQAPPGLAPRAPSLAQFSGPPLSTMWGRGAIHLRAPDPQADLPRPHAHFAIQVSVAISGFIVCRTSRKAPPHSSAGWLIGSDEPHWMNAAAPVATTFYDPLSPSGRRLAARLAGAATSALLAEECTAVRALLETCWRRGWTPSSLSALAENIAVALSSNSPAGTELDPRVSRVVDRLVSAPDEGVRVGELAAGIGLSESRLEHLFHEQVGLPIRQYRMTLRMQGAAEQLSKGASLTAAAYDAGFADSSHFCRTCRRMFGVAPSKLPMRKRR